MRMCFRLDFKALIVLCGVVCFSIAVQAKTQWQQVPGAPVWVQAPLGWKAIGHRHKHALQLQDEQRGKCTMYAVRAAKTTQADFLNEVQRDLGRQYSAVAWTGKKRGVHTGSIQHNKETWKMTLHFERTFRVKRETWRLALLTLAPAGQWSTVSAATKTLLNQKEIGWTRPRPKWLTIPGTQYQVKHPQGDWRVSATDPAAVHFINPLLYGTLQAARMPSRDNDLETVVGLYVQGLSQGEGQWTWAPSKRWRVGAAKSTGVHRRGEATLRRKRSDVVYRMDLYAFPHENDVIIVLGTSSGDGITPVTKTTQTMANSIRKKRR